MLYNNINENSNELVNILKLSYGEIYHNYLDNYIDFFHKRALNMLKEFYLNHEKIFPIIILPEFKILKNTKADFILKTVFGNYYYTKKDINNINLIFGTTLCKELYMIDMVIISVRDILVKVISKFKKINEFDERGNKDPYIDIEAKTNKDIIDFFDFLFMNTLYHEYRHSQQLNFFRNKYGSKFICFIANLEFYIFKNRKIIQLMEVDAINYADRNINKYHKNRSYIKNVINDNIMPFEEIFYIYIKEYYMYIKEEYKNKNISKIFSNWYMSYFVLFCLIDILEREDKSLNKENFVKKLSDLIKENNLYSNLDLNIGYEHLTLI